MEASGYLGGGIGGKLRRKPLRRVAATPYDRPATAARGIGIPASDREGGRWLAKLVDPASRFIARSASRLFSSVLRKRLTAPTAEDAAGEVSRSQSAQEVITAVSHDLPIELPENEAENKNIAATNPEDNVVLEFEQLIKEKSFTKAQYEHLIDVLRSRTTDLDTINSGANGEKIDDVIVPQPATRTDNFNLHEDHVADGHAVTPVELAKEYMRAKVSIDSPSSQNWQSHLFHKNKKVQTNSHYGAKMLDLKIPRSLAQLPAKIPESSYLTPRSLGRSGTYKMQGSLYKIEEALKDGYDGTFSGNEQARGQVLKRSSSTLYSDFRSTCPIRRVRQKLGINSLNRIMDSVLLGNIEPCSSTVKKGFQDLSQNQCPHSLDAREETEGNKILNKVVASGSVQSREMESKIMQGLDKLLPSPKRKSTKPKDNPVEESPSYGIHTNPKGTVDTLCHKKGRLVVIQENGPSTASMHDNNVVDAGVSDYIAVSEDQKPTFEIGEFKDTVVNNIEGSSTISKYSKGFAFPSINVSLTSELPPTPTLPGPLLEKSMVQKVQSATPLVTSGPTEASTTQILSSGNLEGKTCDASPFSLNFKFGSNSAAPVAVSQFSSANSEMVLAVPTVSSSEVCSAPSSLLPETGRNRSALSAKMLSGASNNSVRSKNLSSLDKVTETSSTVAVTGLVGTQTIQQTSDVSASQFRSASENTANYSFIWAPPIVSSSGNSSAAAALSIFPSSGNEQTALESTIPDANDTKFGFGSTKFNNSASSNLDNSTKTHPDNNITGYAGTSANRANDGSILPIFGVPSFASSSATSSLFPHAGGNQFPLVPMTLSSTSNSFSKLGSGFNFTGFGVQSTQVQSRIPHISNSSTSQFPSLVSSSTLGMGIASSSSLGSSPFGATVTHSNCFSSFSAGAGSPSISAAATTTTTLPLAATSGLFGSNSLPLTFTTSGSFVSSASSGGFGSTSVQSTFDAPFIFNLPPNPAFSASRTGTSFTSGHPAADFSFRTISDDQMCIDETQAAGTNRSTGSMVQQFGQSDTSSAATVCSTPAVHSTSLCFQFGSQRNSSLPSVRPQSQATGSAQIPKGGTFAMGSSGGGNSDKSSRRIIKIRKDKRKK